MKQYDKTALRESGKNTYNRVTPKKTDKLIFALGCLGEVGKNMYCIEHEDEILIIDAGVRFP